MPSLQFTHVSWWLQVTFLWDNDVHFVLDQHAYLDFYSASWLKQKSTGRQTYLSTKTQYYTDSYHIGLLLLFNATCLAEKQHIPLL
jgi:hypothetical protein